MTHDAQSQLSDEAATLETIRDFVARGANEGRNLIPEADDEQAWAIESVCAAIEGMVP